MKMCMRLAHAIADLGEIKAKMPPGVGEPILVGQTIQVVVPSQDPHHVQAAMSQLADLAASDPMFLSVVWTEN